MAVTNAINIFTISKNKLVTSSEEEFVSRLTEIKNSPR